MSGINFSGIASGIDGNSIIQAMVDAKNIQKIPFENKLKTNEDETNAYKKLREHLRVLEDKAGIFQTFRGTAISKAVSSSDESAVVGAVSGNAANGTISIKVNQLASSARVTFDSTFSDPGELVAPNLSEPRNIEIKIGSGTKQESFSVSVDSTTTLSELIETINQATSSKISASAVNVGTIQNPQYKLMLSGQESGLEKGTLEVTVDPEITASGTLATNQLSQAKDAIIDVAGVGLITRGSNLINDIFPGLSIEIKQASNSPTILKVSNDTDKTVQKVAEFVAAYNSLKSFISEEDKIKRVEGEKGPKNVYGALARSRVDDELMNGLRDVLRSAKLEGQVGHSVSVLADIGIKTNRDNGQLELDEGVLRKSLSTNPIETGNLLSNLGDKLSSTRGLIYNYTKFQGLIDSAEKANQDEDSLLNDKIQRMEANIQRQKDYLTKLFSRLEETVGKLQGNASALSSLSANTGNKK